MSPRAMRTFRPSRPGLVVAITLTAAGGLMLATTQPPNGRLLPSGNLRAESLDGSALYIPAAAHVSGAADTDWRTDLEIFNPGANPASFEISLLEKNRANPNPATVGFSLVAGMAVRYEDVLQQVFGYTGSAGLKISTTSDDVLASSRTYNRTSLGTYGQFIGAAFEAQAIVTGQDAKLIQLTHSSSRSEGYRTNVGFLSCAPSTITVDADLHTDDGAHLGTVHVDLEPFMFTQLDRIFERVTTTDVADGYVVVRTTTPGGSFFAYASVVDNRTGDPVFVPAVVVDPAATNEAVYIPAAAHVAGSAGTNWRTDVELHNPGSGDARYEVALLRRNRANPDPDTATFDVAAGHCLRLDDILFSVFGFEGAAALRVTPIAGRILATSRTYNLTAGGTYGQFIGGVPESQAVTHPQRAALIELSHHLTAGAGYRTNVGLVNGTGATIVVQADLHSNDGRLLGTRSATLQPFMHTQMDRIFGDVTSGEVPDGFILLSTPDSGGRFFAYASVVDNATGDPVCVPATLVHGTPPPPTPTPTPGPSIVITPLEMMEWLSEWLGRVPGVGDSPDLEEAVAEIQTNGLDSLLEMIATDHASVVTSSHHHLDTDFGDGYVLPRGAVAAGQISLDFPLVYVTPDQISLDYTCATTGLEIDGRPLPIDAASGVLQLSVDDAGHAGGVGTVHGAGAVKTSDFTNTVDGALGIDTTVCLHYPIAGTITFELEDGFHTFTFGPECDGSFDHSGPPGTGDLAFRLRWDGVQDLDLHVREPSGEEIWYADPVSATGGVLDVDSNRACMTQAQQPTENVYWPIGQAPDGSFEYWVVLYSDCGASPTPTYTLSVIEGDEIVREIHGTIVDGSSPHYSHAH